MGLLLSHLDLYHDSELSINHSTSSKNYVEERIMFTVTLSCISWGGESLSYGCNVVLVPR